MELSQLPEHVRDQQDTVITLRSEAPKIYGKLLKKECQLSANNLIEAKIDVSQQNLDRLRELRPADLADFKAPTRNGASLRDIISQAQLLKQLSRTNKF